MYVAFFKTEIPSLHSLSDHHILPGTQPSTAHPPSQHIHSPHTASPPNRVQSWPRQASQNSNPPSLPHISFRSSFLAWLLLVSSRLQDILYRNTCFGCWVRWCISPTILDTVGTLISNFQSTNLTKLLKYVSIWIPWRRNYKMNSWKFLIKFEAVCSYASLSCVCVCVCVWARSRACVSNS